jgi:hypothetical protein
MTIDKLLALAVALACGVMLLRMAIGPKHRQRLDAFAWRTWHNLRHVALNTWHWRRRRQARQAARRTAQAVIARARQPGAHGEVQRDGNVLRPDTFQRPRKPH